MGKWTPLQLRTSKGHVGEHSSKTQYPCLGPAGSLGRGLIRAGESWRFGSFSIDTLSLGVASDSR